MEYNMRISVGKSKLPPISKELKRCKLAFYNKLVEHQQEKSPEGKQRLDN